MVELYRLGEIGVGLSPAATVLKREAVDAVARAEDIVAAAEARAAEIIRDAEAVHAAEKERGYREGKAEAAREALAAAIADQAALDAALARVEADLANLVIAAMRHILAEMEPLPVAQELARAGLRKMRQERRAQLFVAPSLAEGMRGTVEAITAHFPEVELLDVVEDPTLEPPSVVVQSSLGKVSCVLEDAIADVEVLVREALSDRLPADRLTPPPAGLAESAITVNPPRTAT